jgi:hypothetical protein
LLDSHKNCKQIERVLLSEYSHHYLKAHADSWMNNALKTRQSQDYSKTLVEDLLALKKFHASKIALNEKEEYGQDYEQSIHNFYERALTIRLSDKPLDQQKSEMIQLAHEEFNHRHKVLRLLADALMIISTLLFGLGIAIGGLRYALGTTFFFTNAATSRATDFNNCFLDGTQKNEALFTGAM